MKLEEFSATVICCMIICVLCSEAKDTICTREYTITDQLTFTVEKTCEWTVKASDSSAILLLTPRPLVNNVQLCDTDDIIKVMEDIGGEVATLLQINCSRSYSTERVFSSTAKVKVTARGTAAVVNMTWTEYKKQHFTTSHEGTTWLDAQVGCAVEGGTMVTDENYWLASQSPLVEFMLLNGVREIWVGKLFTVTEKECVKVNSTFFLSNKGTNVKTMQTCAIQCSEYNYFAFQDTKCYCLNDFHGVLTLYRDCMYPCPGSLGEVCGGPNTITVYSSDAANTCPLLGFDYLLSIGYLTFTNANCSTKRRYICQKELCGQNFIDNQGSFTFTGHGETDCNWTISVGSHVFVNVDADMDTSLSSCQNHNLSIFTPTTSIADLRQSLCNTGNIRFSGLGPVFIHLTADSLRPTTVNVRWETNITSDSTITTKKGDVITSISTIHNDETEGVSKSTIHIDKTEGVSKSTIHIDKTKGAGDDQQGGHPDGNKIALYVPVTVTMCVIVVVAIFIAICLRRKRKQKKAKGKVDEHSYSNTTTEHQAINLLQSHTERELGEYTALYKPQGSVANAKSQDYAVLHQQLEPAHSPDDTEYSEVNPYVNG